MWNNTENKVLKKCFSRGIWSIFSFAVKVQKKFLNFTFTVELSYKDTVNLNDVEA